MMKLRLIVAIILLLSVLMPVQAAFINLEVKTFSDFVQPGDILKVEAVLRNSDTLPIDGNLVAKVISIEDDKTVAEKDVDFEVKSSDSEVIEVPIPKDVNTGDYRVSVVAEYENRYGEMEKAGPMSKLVEIGIRLNERQIFGVKIIYIGYVLLFFGFLLISYAVYNHQIEKRRRFKLQVDYSTLPQPSKKAAFLGHIAETRNRAFLNIEDLKTHSIVAGATGGGKSVSAQVLVEEALKKNVSVIVFDPTAQWSGFLRKCTEKKMLKYYSKFNMKKKEARAFNGNIHAIEDARELIDIQKHIKPGEITIFTTNKLDPKDVDILIANTIRQVFRSNLQENPELKLLLVYDEVHRLLPKFGGSGAGFLQIERACREFRKWGIGLIMISQVLSDFIGAIKANISTEIQMRTRDESDLERLKTKYGKEVLKGVVKAPVSNGMLENPQYNKGSPYFVEFRPLVHGVTRLSDEELENYNKYNNIIDDLEYQLEQLEKEGQDVFDLKLELKLALDKVKSGNFNMVDIYLEGLKPRLKAAWDKLGKKPKKFEKQYVSEEDLQESIRQAKEEREKDGK